MVRSYLLALLCMTTFFLTNSFSADMSNQTWVDLSTQGKQRLLTPTIANQLFHHGADPVLGNPHGKVTLVEFIDYQCSHCMMMEKDIRALVKANPNLRVIVKEFPLRNALSTYAAQAALAANNQHKFNEFHHQLVELSGDINHDNLLNIAQKAGLNLTQFTSDLDSTAIADRLNENKSLGQDLQLMGTPAFFIGPTHFQATNNCVMAHFIYGQVNVKHLQNSISEMSH
jgi:protein-disulfide isomerase